MMAEPLETVGLKLPEKPKGRLYEKMHPNLNLIFCLEGVAINRKKIQKIYYLNVMLFFSKTRIWMFPKIGGKHPKMDGLWMETPYQNGMIRGENSLFSETSM